MLIYLIFCLYAAEISLSRTWCVVTMPWFFIRSRVRRQAKITPLLCPPGQDCLPLYLVFMGSIQVELL